MEASSLRITDCMPFYSELYSNRATISQRDPMSNAGKKLNLQIIK